MIGLGRQCQRLYLLQAPASHIAHTALVVSTSHSSSNLWHSRLGNLSFSKIALMNELVGSEVLNKSNCCDVRHFSKQKRLPFPSSSHVSAQPFELVHCDL